MGLKSFNLLKQMKMFLHTVSGVNQVRDVHGYLRGNFKGIFGLTYSVFAWGDSYSV